MTSAAVQTYTLCAPWVTPADLRPDEDDCAPCKGVTDVVPSDEILEAAALAASEYLWAESMYAFGGVCEATVRPCGNRQGWGWGAGLWAWTEIPFYLPAGIWPFWGTGCGSCGANGGCNCCGPDAFTLGVIPIVEITEVKLDGEVLAADEYAVVDNLLVRLDPDTGRGIRWPNVCQDVASSDDDTGTMSVTFTWGVAPPQLGVTAARDLACVLVKEACGDDCSEPSPRMTQKVAGGTTLQFLSPNGDIASQLPQSAKLFLQAYGPSIDGVRTPPKLRRPNSGSGFIWNQPTNDLGWQRAGIGGCLGC